MAPTEGKFLNSGGTAAAVPQEANRKWGVSYRWSIVTTPLSRTVSEIWRVTGRIRGCYLPHPSSAPNLTKVTLRIFDSVITVYRVRAYIYCGVMIAEKEKGFAINSWN